MQTACTRLAVPFTIALWSYCLPLQPNLVHPLVSIDWERTQPLPSAGAAFGRQCVLIGREVFVVGWVLDGPGPVVVYNTTNGSWKVHSWSPTCGAALATYYSQLVLIGGLKIATRKITNTVLVWQNGEWCPSLPPMILARSRASAVSLRSHIIVAGGLVTSSLGLTQPTCKVEVFDGHSWKMAHRLPKACCFVSSVLHNDVWYICSSDERGQEVLRAPVQSIVRSTQNNTQSLEWTRLPSIPDKCHCVVVWGQQLLHIAGQNSSTSAINAYFPHTQTWVHVENSPAIPSNCCALTLPTGDLILVAWETAWIGQLKGIEID